MKYHGITPDSGDLQDAINRDFQLAFRYGNKAVQTEAIQCNPYAASCNAMLRTVLKKYLEPNAS